MGLLCFPMCWSLSFSPPTSPGLALCFFLIITAFCTTPMDTNQWEPQSLYKNSILFFASEAYGCIEAALIHPCVLSFPRLTRSGSLLLVQLYPVGMHFLKRIWGHVKKRSQWEEFWRLCFGFFFGFLFWLGVVYLSIYLTGLTCQFLKVLGLELILVLSKLNHLQLTCLYYLALKKQRMDSVTLKLGKENVTSLVDDSLLTVPSTYARWQQVNCWWFQRRHFEQRM